MSALGVRPDLGTQSVSSVCSVDPDYRYSSLVLNEDVVCRCCAQPPKPNSNTHSHTPRRAMRCAKPKARHSAQMRCTATDRTPGTPANHATIIASSPDMRLPSTETYGFIRYDVQTQCWQAQPRFALTAAPSRVAAAPLRPRPREGWLREPPCVAAQWSLPWPVPAEPCPFLWGSHDTR